MKISKLLILITLLFSGQLLADEHWGYEGTISPEHWGDISKDFRTCKTGKHQSPLNITKAKKLAPQPLIFHYELTPEEVINNGHTVQVSVNSDDDYLTFNGTHYLLKQFHFHTPSENQIEGNSFPLEVHFVHTDKEGKLLVLAVMLKEGKANQEIEKAWRVVSKQQDKTIKIKSPFNIDKFLPSNKSYYHFEGSLTTPPCTEGVTWLVLKESVTVSKEQVAKFEKLLGHTNNRPIQPLNDRQIDDE